MATTYEATVTFKVTVEDDHGFSTEEEVRDEIRTTVEEVKLPGYMIHPSMAIEMYVPARVTKK